MSVAGLTRILNILTLGRRRESGPVQLARHVSITVLRALPLSQLRINDGREAIAIEPNTRTSTGSWRAVAHILVDTIVPRIPAQSNLI